MNGTEPWVREETMFVARSKVAKKSDEVAWVRVELVEFSIEAERAVEVALVKTAFKALKALVEVPLVKARFGKVEVAVDVAVITPVIKFPIDEEETYSLVAQKLVVVALVAERL